MCPETVEEVPLYIGKANSVVLLKINLKTYLFRKLINDGLIILLGFNVLYLLTSIFMYMYILL